MKLTRRIFIFSVLLLLPAGASLMAAVQPLVLSWSGNTLQFNYNAGAGNKTFSFPPSVTPVSVIDPPRFYVWLGVIQGGVGVDKGTAFSRFSAAYTEVLFGQTCTGGVCTPTVYSYSYPWSVFPPCVATFVLYEVYWVMGMPSDLGCNTLSTSYVPPVAANTLPTASIIIPSGSVTVPQG
ncbi:MAG: hypothetical protein A2481_00675 [Candidatus Yonathbacteria bacterium RIFOXYC2_FULL_47_9]|nr:MAG: hypothetical protein A2481_00675 [Candidatus Yonathbacteria bacterium RIFOXYC2_FULL_47_9]HAT68150.1 hypothetical protein [Candidatus Yonathbacteria bacterium]